MLSDMNGRINRFYWKLMQRPAFCNPAVINGLSGALALACPKSGDVAPDAERLAAQIRERGYTEPLELLSPAQIDAMRAYFEGQLCHDPWRPHLGQFQPHAIPSDETNMGWYSEQQIINAPHILDALAHPLVLGTVERVFGCKPTLGFLNCWWAYPERAGAKGSQRFHRDFDGLRFIKLFIYLTDVDEDGGPHVYVADTHDRPELYTPRAMTDEEVAATFGRDRFVTLTGRKGMCFLADTRGVHKGLLPKKSERLAVIAQYALWRSAHQPERPLRPVPPGLYDAYVMRRFLEPRTVAPAIPG
jgi:hypothetical protein